MHTLTTTLRTTQRHPGTRLRNLPATLDDVASWFRGAARRIPLFRRSPLTREEVALLIRTIAHQGRRIENMKKSADWQMRSTNMKLCAEIERLDKRIAAIFSCLEDMCKAAGLPVPAAAGPAPGAEARAIMAGQRRGHLSVVTDDSFDDLTAARSGWSESGDGKAWVLKRRSRARDQSRYRSST